MFASNGAEVVHEIDAEAQAINNAINPSTKHIKKVIVHHKRSQQPKQQQDDLQLPRDLFNGGFELEQIDTEPKNIDIEWYSE